MLLALKYILVLALMVGIVAGINAIFIELNIKKEKKNNENA